MLHEGKAYFIILRFHQKKKYVCLMRMLQEMKNALIVI